MLLTIMNCSLVFGAGLKEILQSLHPHYPTRTKYTLQMKHFLLHQVERNRLLQTWAICVLSLFLEVQILPQSWQAISTGQWTSSICRVMLRSSFPQYGHPGMRPPEDIASPVDAAACKAACSLCQARSPSASSSSSGTSSMSSSSYS